jgi:hypothetical protein
MMFGVPVRHGFFGSAGASAIPFIIGHWAIDSIMPFIIPA